MPPFIKDTSLPNLNGVAGQNGVLKRDENFQILMHQKTIERGEEPVGWLAMVVEDATVDEVHKSIFRANLVDFLGNKVPFSKDLSTGFPEVLFPKPQ